ncbi:MAG: type III-A CRISPR-associated RAMP protein Csm3 [Spirochaetes bacterium]|nr:MAG: type III-A CRISPR-associated RAMP protein Csm3 [Spirochaetota bacterium]
MAYNKHYIKSITGKIKVLTGLHIGAGSDVIEIGGMDNPIIKNPITGEPYIPGSSLKGKMRSLMEWYFNKVKVNGGEPCKCGEPDCEICRVFGCAIQNTEKSVEKSKKRGPTRLIVRDAFLTEETKEKFAGKNLVEDKSENSINRLTAAATPRHLERVVPGTEFDFSLSYRFFDMEDGFEIDERYFRDVVLKALAILEHDFLGGGGSRGSGKIMFVDLRDEKEKEVILPEV